MALNYSDYTTWTGRTKRFLWKIVKMFLPRTPIKKYVEPDRLSTHKLSVPVKKLHSQTTSSIS